MMYHCTMIFYYKHQLQLRSAEQASLGTFSLKCNRGQVYRDSLMCKHQLMGSRAFLVSTDYLHQINTTGNLLLQLNEHTNCRNFSTNIISESLYYCWLMIYVGQNLYYLTGHSIIFSDCTEGISLLTYYFLFTIDDSDKIWRQVINITCLK